MRSFPPLLGSLHIASEEDRVSLHHQTDLRHPGT